MHSTALQKRAAHQAQARAHGCPSGHAELCPGWGGQHTRWLHTKLRPMAAPPARYDKANSPDSDTVTSRPTVPDIALLAHCLMPCSGNWGRYIRRGGEKERALERALRAKTVDIAEVQKLLQDGADYSCPYEVHTSQSAQTALWANSSAHTPHAHITLPLPPAWNQVQLSWLGHMFSRQRQRRGSMISELCARAHLLLCVHRTKAGHCMLLRRGPSRGNVIARQWG